MRQPSHGVLFEGGAPFPLLRLPSPSSLCWPSPTPAVLLPSPLARHVSLSQGLESNRLCLNFDSVYTKHFSLLNFHFAIYKTEIIIPTYGIVLRMKP